MQSKLQGQSKLQVARQLASGKVSGEARQGKARGQQGRCRNGRLGKLQLGKQGKWQVVRQGEASGKVRKDKARQGKTYTVCPHFKQSVIQMLEVKESMSLCLPCSCIEM